MTEGYVWVSVCVCVCVCVCARVCVMTEADTNPEFPQTDQTCVSSYQIIAKISLTHTHTPSFRVLNLDPTQSFLITVTEWQLYQTVDWLVRDACDGSVCVSVCVCTPVVSWLWWSRRVVLWLQRGPPVNTAPQSGAAWNTSPYCGTATETHLVIIHPVYQKDTSVYLFPLDQLRHNICFHL